MFGKRKTSPGISTRVLRAGLYFGLIPLTESVLNSGFQCVRDLEEIVITKRVLSIASVILAASVSCYVTGLYLGFLNGKDLCGYQYPIIGSIGWVNQQPPRGKV